MNRYFLDFDEVPDRCGLTMYSAKHACFEALLSMPEYVAEKLECEGGRSKMISTVRDGEKAVFDKIVVSMHVEDGSGTINKPPFAMMKRPEI